MNGEKSHMGITFLVQAELDSSLTPKESQLLRPSGDPRVAMDYLCQLLEDLSSGSLLLVFHLPLISEIASLAIDGNLSRHYSFPCASIMHLKSDVAAPGCFEFVNHYQAPGS